MKTLLAALLLVAAIVGKAQNTIRPGAPLIRYEWIKPSHDFYRNVITDTSGKILYEFVMENSLRIDSVNSQLVFARYRQVPPGSFSTDTSFTSWRLKPLRMHEIHYQREVSFEMSFADTVASVRTIRKGAASVKTYPMKNGYFEDNMIEYIFPWLELKKGLVYTLDNFNKDAPKPSDPYTLEYVFDDVWSLGAGYMVSCHVLHFTHGDSTGYIWVNTATHAVLKAEGNFKGSRFVVSKL